MKFNNESINTALNEWLANSKEAEKKYGHISNWDVSNVTNIYYLIKFNQLIILKD